MDDITEVRRCGRCGEAAAVCIADWKHTSMGVQTGQNTRDFACQACGNRFSISPRMWLWVYVGGTALFCPTVIGGAIFLALAVHWLWREQVNPVVPDAVVPEPKFTDELPLRRCSCGQASHCQQVTKRTTGGIPTGTEYSYLCDSCGVKFTLDSPLGHAFSWTSGVVLVVLGALCIPPGLLLWLLAPMLWMLSMWRLLALVRYPVFTLPKDAK